MRNLSTVFMLGLGLFMHMSTPLSAAPYLEMSRSCDGERLDSKKRFKINDWNGQSKNIHSAKVFDFSVDCDGADKHVLELFLTSLASNQFASKRYKEEDGALYKRMGTRRKSVKIRDARCEQVPERVRTYPSDREARRACRGSPMPMACELEYQGRDKWVNQMVERCYRAKYEMRDVPQWSAFPFGYAPLPKGARIVNVRARIVAQATSTPKPPAFSDVGPTGSIGSPDTGPGLGTFLFFAMLLGGGYLYFKGLGAPPPEGYRAYAESRLGGAFNFGGSQREEEKSHDYSHTRTDHQEKSEYTQKSGFDPASGDLPTSREEAYTLLNIDADTPIDVANKIYWAMAKAWHVDGATGEEDRKRREIKMKQLNAAKEFLTGKRR